MPYWPTACRRACSHCERGPALRPTGVSGTPDLLELAVALVTSLFGLDSNGALATVVGVLVEVPVMLSLVALANRAAGMVPTG
jgi:ACR3 family arsenite transporter